jgi:hypothetical protein
MSLCLFSAGRSCSFAAHKTKFLANFTQVRFDSSFIRVFDMAKDGEYIPFEATMSLCHKWGLPCVVSRHEPNLRLQSIFDDLARRPQYQDVKGMLEGYVIRGTKEGSSRIAKVRCDDLNRVDFINSPPRALIK